MKKNKKVIGFIVLAVTIIIALGIGIGIYNTPANRLTRQLEVANKYLEEENYESAVVEFTKAIEIDPMCVEAYLGLAEAYVGLGDYENALLALKQGYEKTGNERLLRVIQKIEEKMASANEHKATVTEGVTDYAIEWEDEVLETLVREYLEKSDGEIYESDVIEIEELYICGNHLFESLPDISCIYEYCGPTVYKISYRGEQIEVTDQGNIYSINDLKHFTSLRTLYFISQDIGNANAISDLTNLVDLRLDGNNLNDISGLSGLTNLVSLRLDGNYLSDISGLSNLTNLTNLDLSRNNNNLKDISALCGLTNLTNLNLGGNNNISDISALSGLTNLTDLDLRENRLEDISALSGLTNLTNLDLGVNNISDISALSSLTDLTYLNLEGNNISDISALSSLTDLTYLNLQGNNITDYTPVAFVPNLYTD